MIKKKNETMAEDSINEKEETVEIPIGKYLDNVRKNPWIAATFLLGIALVLVLIFGMGRSGGGVSADEASQKVMDFINSNPDITGEVSLVSTEKQDQFYQVTLSYQGQEVPVYTTLDGKFLVSNPVSLDKTTPAEETTPTQPETPQDVPKSDKPKVEAFIFSYCPYGLQFEKALFPVYDLLKNKADINIVAIGAMHGEFEHQESLRQISIEKLYNKDKLFAYLKEFDTNTDIGSCSGEETCLNKYLPAIYTKLGIDKTKVENYMKTNAEAIYQAQNARASELGIGGSPTFVINGVKVDVARNADAIKEAVCNAFSTAPTECSQTLSTTAASAGFGASASGSGTAASCG